MYAHTQVHVHVCIYACAYTHGHVRMGMYACACAHVHAHTRRYVYVNTPPRLQCGVLCAMRYCAMCDVPCSAAPCTCTGRERARRAATSECPRRRRSAWHQGDQRRSVSGAGHKRVAAAPPRRMWACARRLQVCVCELTRPPRQPRRTPACGRGPPPPCRTAGPSGHTQTASPRVRVRVRSHPDCVA